jgi:hypothetical protein
MRTLNSITVFADVSLREYEMDTTNVDEYSASFRISRDLWKTFLMTEDMNDYTLGKDNKSQPLIVSFEMFIKKHISARLDTLINAKSNELAVNSLRLEGK